jgi:hypothetical protein
MLVKMVTVSQIDGNCLALHDDNNSVYSVCTLMPGNQHTISAMHRQRWSCLHAMHMHWHMHTSMSACHQSMSCRVKYVMHAISMAQSIKECFGHSQKECLASVPGLCLQPSSHSRVVHCGVFMACSTCSNTHNMCQSEVSLKQKQMPGMLAKNGKNVKFGIGMARMLPWSGRSNMMVGGVVPPEDCDRATLTHRPAGSPRKLAFGCQPPANGQNGVNNGSSQA